MKTKGQPEQSMFSEQWGIYKSVIEHNYMYHAELIDVVRESLIDFVRPSILDLGCGDSYVISESLNRNQPVDYWGVDSAAMALESGRDHLNGVEGEITLINKDLLEALEEMEHSFDVIISGYSLHHLEAGDKEKCFSLIANLLSDGGVFIFYDLESRHDETNPEYIVRACKVMDDDWNQFESKVLKDIREHVEGNDIPESEIFYMDNFDRVGFSEVNKVFRDRDAIFSAYTARKTGGKY